MGKYALKLKERKREEKRAKEREEKREKKKKDIYCTRRMHNNDYTNAHKGTLWIDRKTRQSLHPNNMLARYQQYLTRILFLL